MPADLYRYPLAATPGPNGSARRPIGDDWIEVAALEGWVYVAGEGHPPGLDGIAEPAALTPEIVAASPRHRFLLEQLAAVRYGAETAGVAWRGWPVATDRDSRPNLIAAYQSAAAGLRQDGGVWKFADGVARPLTNAEVQSMALAVLAHVQRCFDREAELAAQVRAAIIPDEGVIVTGWPQ